MDQLHKQVYIPSIEASDIYSYMHRNKEIDIKYIGMIPSSLELNKLISKKIKLKRSQNNKEKYMTDDIINVKFSLKVDSGAQLISKLYNKIENLNETRNNYKNKLQDFIKTIELELDEEKWTGRSNSELRHILYENGFTYNNEPYVVYKRSSAKSRVGECLFIRAKLYEQMIKWSRLGLEFRNRDGIVIDYPSLLAYESLVGSSLEHAIEINPDNILIVDDVESMFIHKANIVKTGEDEFLDSFSGEATIKNSLFDGEALLESSYFPEGKSMMLLRNHMFKSAAFSCNIQEFLRDHCPTDINFETWEIPTMFKNTKIKAKDVHLIITPSSLKALKFSSLLGSDKNMWNHWKRVVKRDGSIFGVCKSEKQSKRGVDNQGRTLQQTSYQMLNSLPLTKEEVKLLTSYEQLHIEKMKNDDDFFAECILETANELNSNEMFYSLYIRNKDIANTDLFKKFRKRYIHNYMNYIRHGKVRLSGDYLVMLGNPLEFLYHSIGLLDVGNPQSYSLVGNEVCTTMFQNEKKLSGFRNPHTSPNNVLLVKNKIDEKILRYFNLTSNIVCVNAIQFPIQDILSGADYDSDTVLLIEDSNLLKITERVFGNYNVCVNHVISSKRIYDITNHNMALIDNQLSNSQRFIGRTVNTGQLCMSRYWDMINKGHESKSLEGLMRKIDVVTVLSGICIDLAKKMFEIDINKEINHIAKFETLKKEKPMFWKYVSKASKISTQKYDCPMDYLYETMSSLDDAERRETISFQNMLMPHSLSKSLRKQEYKIFEYVEKMISKINYIFSSNSSEDEKYIMLDDVMKYYEFKIKKMKISKDTMYSLIIKIHSDEKNKFTARLLNVLYSSKKDEFLSVFRQN